MIIPSFAVALYVKVLTIVQGNVDDISPKYVPPMSAPVLLFMKDLSFLCIYPSFILNMLLPFLMIKLSGLTNTYLFSVCEQIFIASCPNNKPLLLTNLTLPFTDAAILQYFDIPSPVTVPES